MSANEVFAVIRILIVGLSSLASFVAYAENGPPPARDFARKASYDSAKISPQGQYLAVETYIDDQSALGIIDLKSRKISGALKFVRGEHVGGYWWVGPDRIVVAIATRDGLLDQPALTGELYAMDADGSNKTYLFGYRGGKQAGTHLGGAKAEYSYAWMVDPTPEESDSAIISVWPWHRSEGESPIIYRLNVHNGRQNLITLVDAYPPIRVATANGVPIFATGQDRNSRHVAMARPKDGGWSPVALDAETLNLHGASKDGKSVFFSSDDGSGTTCLRQFEMDDGRITSLSCNEGADIGSTLYGFDDGRPVAISNDSRNSIVTYLRPEHDEAKMLQTLIRSFPGQRVRVTSATVDGNRVVVFTENERNAGEFFLLDRITGRAEFLFARRPWIKPEQMRPMESIQYRTRDGATIHGYLTRPETGATGKLPLVLLPHGGPHGVRDNWEWDPWVQFLATRGFAVLQVNYRGSGGYGFAHESAGYRRWGTLMQDDLTDAVRWAIKQQIADPDRVCIVGGSYGGYAALMSATREPALYRCAVGMAGVYDLVSQAEDSDTSERLMGRNYLNRVLGEDKQLKAEQSPINHLNKLKIPVLIAHGTEDRRVPFSQAKKLRTALEKSGKPYEWMEFAGEEHGFYKDANHEAFLNKLLEFLNKHIGDKASAPAVATEASATDSNR